MHKLLVEIFKKDMTSLPHKQQRILHIHKHNNRILYKPGPQQFMADWLSWHNCEIGKDEKIPRIGISINVIEMYTNNPQCMTAEVWLTTIDLLPNYVMHGWQLMKCKVRKAQAILVIQRWHSGYRQDHNENQGHKTSISVRKSTQTAAYKPPGPYRRQDYLH